MSQECSWPCHFYTKSKISISEFHLDYCLLFLTYPFNSPDEYSSSTSEFLNDCPYHFSVHSILLTSFAYLLWGEDSHYYCFPCIYLLCPCISFLLPCTPRISTPNVVRKNPVITLAVYKLRVYLYFKGTARQTHSGYYRKIFSIIL